ncbi:hypothetical protein J3486_21510 [Streptomyces sp. VRA16 Mangrove soil]|nr:hypothetical protein [Streptomyces sp. VRA16 Mangrove soil]
MVTQQYSREEESRNGADWEWWFHDGTHGFGMRVQAKKAHKDGRYVLRHTVRSTGALQSTQLVEDAAASGCLPFYVFYNHKSWTAPGEALAPADCDHTRADQRQMGCTIVSALVVQRVIAEGMPRASDHVKQHSLPWNRLLCDSHKRYEEDTGLEAAFDHICELHADGRSDLSLAVERPEVYSYVVRSIKRAEDRESRVPAQDRVVLPDVAERPYIDLTDTPLYRKFAVLADRPLPPLPERVRHMLHSETFEPPDERLAGTALIDLTGC